MVTAVLPNARAFPLPELSQRRSELQNRIAELGEKMGLPVSKVNLKITKFSEGPCTRKLNVYVPPTFLFRVEDLPQRFRINDILDPRLDEEAFLKEFQQWINASLQAAGIPHSCQKDDYPMLQRYLMMMREPRLYEKAKDFAIAHELGHISSLEKSPPFPKTAVILIGLFVLAYIGGLALLATVGLHALFVILPVMIGLGGGIVYVIFKENPHLNPIQNEINADRRAFEVLQDAMGGIYYFSISRIKNLMTRTASNQDKIDSEGNNLQDKKHPPLTKRIEYLKKWHIEKHPTAPLIGFLR